MAKKSKEGVVLLFPDEDFEKYEDRYDKANIADATREYSLIGGINRNISRHIASGYDGLKPVARRILLVLNKEASSKYQKVNKITGLVMGSFHPHGDSSIEAVIGSMGQSWNNNKCYVDGYGNYGTEQGDLPAAGRYITCKISDFAKKCFFEDFKYAALDSVSAYTGEEMEPLYLPAKYPVALVNPQFSSIGWGTASNIAPFNFTEVCEAAISLLKNTKTPIHLIPDFPNKCEVIADKHLEEVNKHGVGKVTVRATISIDHASNIINITSLPLNIGTKSVITEIAKLKVDKKIDGIIDVKDHTNKVNGVCIQIILNKDTNPDDMIQDLIKKNIGLQKTFNVQLKFIEDFKEMDPLTPKEYLLNWIDFRREIVQSMHNKKYVLLMEDKHLNDIKLFIFHKSRIEETVKIIRASKNLDEIVKNLVDKYHKDCGMTTLQARAIAGLRMYEFSKEQYQNFIDKGKQLEKDLAESEKIINDPSLIDGVIIKELEEGIKLFGEPRRSKIIQSKKDAKKVDDKMVLVAISRDGFIKKLDSKKFTAIGKLGNDNNSNEIIVQSISNDKSLIIFDSNGKASCVPVAGIPEMTIDENGIEISRYFKTTGYPVASLRNLDKDAAEQVSFLFVSSFGFAKKTKATELINIKDIKDAISIEEDDRLVAVDKMRNDDDRDIVIYTDNGNGIRLSLSDIPMLKANAKGRRLLPVLENEHIAGYNFISKTGCKYLMYITTSGRVKITELKLFPRMNVKDKPLNLLDLGKNDHLVSVLPVNKTDKVMVYKKKSDPELISVSNLTPSVRAAKAEKIITVNRGDVVLKAKIQ